MAENWSHFGELSLSGIFVFAAYLLLLGLCALGVALLLGHLFFKRTRLGRSSLRWYLELCEEGELNRHAVELAAAEAPGGGTAEGTGSAAVLAAGGADPRQLLAVGGGEPRCGRNVRRIGCCSTVCLCLILLVLGVLCYVGWMQVSRAHNDDSWHDPHVTPPEFPRYMGCGNCKAGNKSDSEIAACVEPCFSLRFVKLWESFAQQHPWKLVYFPSRRDPGTNSTVNISAWWLPGDPAALTPGAVPPRIVVLHGLASSNNHCGVQATCFLLRTMGFSCLTPTVRDYGLSGSSRHPKILPWAYDQHLDLLGAWDYAINDPEGLLGGPVPARMVGVMGFSKGALATAIAFGLERGIPAAWIDSAPFTGLYGMVDYYVRSYAGVLTPFIRNPVYVAAQLIAKAGGVSIDKYNALDLLKQCFSPPRRIAISQDMGDNTVPISEATTAVRFLSGLPECYDVSVYMPPARCFGDMHHTYMWTFPDDARQELCKFWSKAFNRSRRLCRLDKLPRLQEHDPVSMLPRVPLHTL